MQFEFVFDSSDMDLWDIDWLDKDLDLLDTDILSKHFIFLLQDVFKASWRHAFKMPWRRLQRNYFLCLKMSFRDLVRCLQDVIKSFWEQKIVFLEDIFKTS